jgi:hypothetical protein
MSDRPEVNPVHPIGWVELPPSKYHPGKRVFEGPCACCGKILRRSTWHFETRTTQFCSKKCMGAALKAEVGSIRWRLGRAWVYQPNHPRASNMQKLVGYVLRSHLVMEQSIGRFLEETEIVHHRNEVISDDRIENLELTNRSDHRAHHAAEEIAKYGTIARWK